MIGENLEQFLDTAKLHLAANSTGTVTLRDGTAEDAIRHAAYLQERGIIAVPIKLSAMIADRTIFEQVAVLVARTNADKESLIHEMEERAGKTPGAYDVKLTILLH